MDKLKIDQWVMQNHDKFTPIQMQQIRTELELIDDDKYLLLQCVELKDPTIMLIISAVAGYMGVDRFMFGEIAMGILKIFL